MPNERLLTQGQICGVVSRHLKKYPYHKDYPLRRLIAQAQDTKTHQATLREVFDLAQKIDNPYLGKLLLLSEEQLESLKGEIPK